MHKQVIVMRYDDKMRKVHRGKIASQAAHASMKVLFDIGIIKYIMTDKDGLQGHLCIPLTEATQPWIQGLFTKIVVRVDTEAELHEIHKKAKDVGLLTAIIQDAGLTEFDNVPTFTCVAIGPDLSEKIDPITKHLKLL